MNGNQENKKLSKEKMKKKLIGFFSKFKYGGKIFNNKNIIVATSVLVICGAVYLNYYLFSADKTEDETPVAENLDQGKEVSTNEDYFSSAAVSRQKARDEALQVLQEVVDSTDALEDVKNEAYNGINRIADEIKCESNIEQLVISKGFEQCIAVVNENSASIVVKSDGLLANEVAQIKEIVYKEASISPKNITIIEKN